MCSLSPLSLPAVGAAPFRVQCLLVVCPHPGITIVACSRSSTRGSQPGASNTKLAGQAVTVLHPLVCAFPCGLCPLLQSQQYPWCTAKLLPCKEPGSPDTRIHQTCHLADRTVSLPLIRPTRMVPLAQLSACRYSCYHSSGCHPAAAPLFHRL